jgi:hypothetical protein
MGPHGVTSVEIVKLTTAVDGSKPPYQLMFTAHLHRKPVCTARCKVPKMPELLSDIRNFYDGTPDVLIGEVVPVPR